MRSVVVVLVLASAVTVAVVGERAMATPATPRERRILRCVRNRRPPCRPIRASRDGRRSVESTAYCLTGNMANGRRARRGAVASNAHALGTRVTVSAGPYGRGPYTVEDRIGSGSQLDFAMPGDCDGALQWGRRFITLEVVR